MFYCQTCLTPSTRPRIVFNNGICNACNYAKKVNDNIINFDTRKKELEDLIVRIKEKKISNNSNYDCIIPWSGGKDSSAIALHLKEDYGINPLLVIGHRHTLPQHKIMGEVDESLLKLIGYSNYVIVKGENNVK